MATLILLLWGQLFSVDPLCLASCLGGGDAGSSAAKLDRCHPLDVRSDRRLRSEFRSEQNSSTLLG
jgi:hypothetical protein